MKYAIPTLKYIVRNFPRLLLGIAPVTVAAVFFLHPINTFVYNPSAVPAGLKDFPALFFWQFRSEISSRWYLHIAFAVIHLLTCCYLTAIVEKDFKVGRLSVRSPLYNINNTFPPVAKAYFVIGTTFFVYKLLLTCIFTLISYVLLSAGVAVLYSDIVIATLALILFFVYVGFSHSLFLAPVTMLIYGYTFRESFGVTIKLGDKSQNLSVIIGLAAPFIIQFIVCYLMAVLPTPNIVYRVVEAVLLSLISLYIVVYSLVTGYSISGVPRRDKVYLRQVQKEEADDDI